MSNDCVSRLKEQYPVELMPAGWATEEVTVPGGSDGSKSCTRLEIRDLKTDKRYIHEPLRQTAFKCLKLVVAIPFYTLAYMAWNALRIPTTALSSVALGLEKTFEARSCGEVIQRLFDSAINGGSAAIAGLWTVVRAPFYTQQMFFGALVGIVSPLEGRKIVGRAEEELHQKPKRNDVFRYEFIGENPLWRALVERNCPYTVYLAPCMQTLNSSVILRSQVYPLQK